jgi:hypothetical protein
MVKEMATENPPGKAMAKDLALDKALNEFQVLESG